MAENCSIDLSNSRNSGSEYTVSHGLFQKKVLIALKSGLNPGHVGVYA